MERRNPRPPNKSGTHGLLIALLFKAIDDFLTMELPNFFKRGRILYGTTLAVAVYGQTIIEVSVYQGTNPDWSIAVRE